MIYKILTWNLIVISLTNACFQFFPFFFFRQITIELDNAEV